MIKFNITDEITQVLNPTYEPLIEDVAQAQADILNIMRILESKYPACDFSELEIDSVSNNAGKALITNVSIIVAIPPFLS